MSFPLHVRFAYPDQGYPAEQKQASEYLKVGELYTVARLDVGSSNSSLTLMETPAAISFNTVMFEPVFDDEVTIGVTVAWRDVHTWCSDSECPFDEWGQEPGSLRELALRHAEEEGHCVNFATHSFYKGDEVTE